MERYKELGKIKTHNWPEKIPAETNLVKPMLSHNPIDRPEVSDILKNLTEVQPKSSGKTVSI
jgi:hypothetical protein